MSVSKKILVGEYKLGSQYVELREKLQAPEYTYHWDKRMAFWATPTDKRLPIALLGRTLREILETPFEDLLRYPSIGEKKFAALISLLDRASNTSKAELASAERARSSISWEKPPISVEGDTGLQQVSEFQWNTWQRVVLDQGLADEKIGRLCTSLEEMPRVLWHKTLRTYCHVSLDELRKMKTHGEKRVQAILRLFRDIFEIAAKFQNAPHLKIRMSLRWTDDLERWVNEALTDREFPSRDELFEHLISPLLAQLRIDASEGVIRLAETRLGLHGPITSVRQVAKEMHIARARVYQLLNEISDIVFVRWPEGNTLVHKLWDKFIREMIDSPSQEEYEQWIAATELFFPAGKKAFDSFEEETLPTRHHPPLEIAKPR